MKKKLLIGLIVLVLVVLIVLLIVKCTNKTNKKEEKTNIEVCQNKIAQQVIDSIVFKVKKIKYTGTSSIAEIELVNSLNEDIYVKEIKINFKDSSDHVTEVTGFVEGAIPADGTILLKTTSKENLINTVSVEYEIIK